MELKKSAFVLWGISEGIVKRISFNEWLPDPLHPALPKHKKARHGTGRG
jgi:hypothetical protein